MADETSDDAETTEPPAHHSLGERLREHLLAAEVAAEEAAGYGAATTIVEATETAVDPEHELGDGDEPDGAATESRGT